MSEEYGQFEVTDVSIVEMMNEPGKEIKKEDLADKRHCVSKQIILYNFFKV